MKKNFCLVNWLMIIIMLIGGLIVPANADSNLAPYLTAKKNGKLIKKERLVYQISGADTFYFDSKGNQMEKPLIRWLPKFNNDLEQRVVFAQSSANTANFSLYFSQEYSESAADSLYRTYPTKAENAIILFNSPRNQRLRELERRVCDLESRDVGTNGDDLASFRQSILQETNYLTQGLTQAAMDSINAFTERISDAIDEQATFDEAVDEQLSLIKGRTWGRIKNKHGITMSVDESTDEEEQAAKPEKPKKKKRNKRRATDMSTPRRF